MSLVTHIQISEFFTQSFDSFYDCFTDILERSEKFARRFYEETTLIGTTMIQRMSNGEGGRRFLFAAADKEFQDRAPHPVPVQWRHTGHTDLPRVTSKTDCAAHFFIQVHFSPLPGKVL